VEQSKLIVDKLSALRRSAYDQNNAGW